jgi:hypothetical protein
MFRYVNSDPALVEAHARTHQAMYELELAIREAFGRYDQLARRLKDFDRRLQAARLKCHAEPLGNGYTTTRTSASVVGADQSHGSATPGVNGSRKRTLSKLAEAA